MKGHGKAYIKKKIKKNLQTANEAFKHGFPCLLVTNHYLRKILSYCMFLVSVCRVVLYDAVYMTNVVIH